MAAVPALDRLLRPRSVAIIGASDKPGALGGAVLANLQRNGFDGAIHLVNPRLTEIGGRPCLATIEALPEGVDAAILATARATVLESLRTLAAKKTGAAVIFAAGFAEGGETGAAEQAAIARIAGEAGMLVLGPNCLGATNYLDRIPLTFVETAARPPGPGKAVGVVSQSGALACVLCTTLAARGLGLSFSISTGNEAASGIEDYVEMLVDDPATQAIALIVEQFRRPKRFLQAAARAHAAGKTILLLHPGASSAARRSAATHTGALAGDHALMRAKVEHAGVVMAQTLEELGDIAEIALRCPPVPAAGLAVVGESGAFKALTFDFCEALALDLPAIDDSDSPALRTALPEFVGVSNPLDLTAQGLADPDLYRRVLRALFDDSRFGAIMIGLIQTDPVTTGIKLPPILQAVREGRPAKPVILAGLDEGASPRQADIDALRALGVPYFPSTERVFRAVKRLNAAARRDRAVSPAPPLSLAGLAAGMIPEHRAKALLAPLGIAFPPALLVTSAAAAVTAAEELGYPVALKAQSPALSHKSDAGAVILSLADAEAVGEGWRRLHDNLERARPRLALDGVLVERMARPGVELIVGARRDPDWGPIIMVGFGGVMAELKPDIRLLAPDLTVEGIISDMDRLNGAALLHGFRGSAPLDVDAVARMASTLGRLMLGEPAIAEIDLNPVIAYPAGEGALALDALILARDG